MDSGADARSRAALRRPQARDDGRGPQAQHARSPSADDMRRRHLCPGVARGPAGGADRAGVRVAFLGAARRASAGLRAPSPDLAQGGLRRSPLVARHVQECERARAAETLEVEKLRRWRPPPPSDPRHWTRPTSWSRKPARLRALAAGSIFSLGHVLAGRHSPSRGSSSRGQPSVRRVCSIRPSAALRSVYALRHAATVLAL